MAEKTEVTNPQEQDGVKTVSINRVIPEDIFAQYADGMVVKNQDGLFNLYFFQSRWPIAITPEELAAIDTVDARCIAHLVMTPDQMKKNIDALIENFRKFEKRVGELLKAAEAKEEE